MVSFSLYIYIFIYMYVDSGVIDALSSGAPMIPVFLDSGVRYGQHVVKVVLLYIYIYDISLQ